VIVAARMYANGKPAEVQVRTEGPTAARQFVHLTVTCSDACVPLLLDENHAQALVLALQAAIAEVQARAVSL
jgi:hypothetical protein